MLLDKFISAVYHSQSNNSTVIFYCHLTETQLRRIHRNWGYPSAYCMYTCLDKEKKNSNFSKIEHFVKYCHYCQLYAALSIRFKFDLKNDKDMNHILYVDIVHIDGGFMMHIVDEETDFQTDDFIKDRIAKEAFEAIERHWNNTLVGSSQYIVHNSGREF